MRVFAISDLHLTGGDDKPMEIFGAHWQNHMERIEEDWRARVRDDDIVLIAGDISWAMQLEHAEDDLRRIGQLPGYKVLLRGNHDYWWSSVTRVRGMLPEKMYVIQNDAVKIGEYVFCGSRGWTQEDTQDDRKIFTRELMRLEMSLQRAEKLGGRITVMCHYPPVTEDGKLNEAGEIIAEYPVRNVVYGHLHGQQSVPFNGVAGGVRFYCTSCDKLDFHLQELECGDEGQPMENGDTEAALDER